MTSAAILKKFDKLNVWRQGDQRAPHKPQGDQRAPHKPLLILYALGQW